MFFSYGLYTCTVVFRMPKNVGDNFFFSKLLSKHRFIGTLFTRGLKIIYFRKKK